MHCIATRDMILACSLLPITVHELLCQQNCSKFGCSKESFHPIVIYSCAITCSLPRIVARQSTPVGCRCKNSIPATSLSANEKVNMDH